MSRYIDVERIPNDSFWEGMTPKEKAKVLQWFLQAPTADVAKIKRGDWVEQHLIVNLGEGRDCEVTNYQCSSCNNYSLTTSPWCPKCGARMSPIVKNGGIN